MVEKVEGTKSRNSTDRRKSFDHAKTIHVRASYQWFIRVKISLIRVKMISM